MTKRSWFWASVIMMVSVLFLSQTSFAGELDDIRAAIRKSGAGWMAGPTSMTRLPVAERAKRGGLVLPRLTGREKLLQMDGVAALPPRLDWRNNGGNFVTPVKNQAGCGSCWAFATAAALESVTVISNHMPGVDLDLSEKILVICSGAGSCAGGSHDGASNFIRDIGLPVESCFPYDLTAYGSCNDACANWQASTYKITSWSYVATTSPTVEALKSALFNKGPLVATLSIYDDFYGYVSGIYQYVYGELRAYHAVLLVGYDDVGQYFIAKNSWGTGWGEAGYFNIAYSELNSVVNFGDYTIAYTGSSPVCSPFISQFIPSEGGAGDVSVTLPGGCSWAATSDVGWITITAGASGTGNGLVSFSVAANPQAFERTGSITIAGQAYTVTQEAGQGCTYSIAPTGQSMEASGGAGNVSITALSGCDWTAVSNHSWITITSGSSGSGNGTVNYSVASNGTTSSRTGTMTIAGSTFTVTQAGQSCTYSISPTSASAVAGGGTGSVSVTALGGCGWTAVSNDGWITITSGSSGSGNGTVNYSVASNGTTSSRTGTMTIAGSTFTVTQEAAGGVPDITVVPTSTISFGNVKRYTTSSKAVSVSNTYGTAPLTISSIRLRFTGMNAGLSAASYFLTNNCPSTLEPGASCSVTITFRPGYVNTLSGYLDISSNDPDESLVSVYFWGKGVY